MTDLQHNKVASKSRSEGIWNRCWQRNFCRDKDSVLHHHFTLLGQFGRFKRHSAGALSRFWFLVLTIRACFSQIPCEATFNLCKSFPHIIRPFSLAHAVTVDLHRSNLFVDGSHHLGSTYDSHPDRNGVPWAACVNSSMHTGIAPNCVCVFYDSPSFESIREASKQLGEQV